MVRRKLFLLPLITAGVAGLMATAPAKATIIIDIVNGGPSTVQVGQTIPVIYKVSTDNPNGVYALEAQTQESINGGTSADGTGTPPQFTAAVTTTASITNTTSNHPIVETFSDFYQSINNVTLAGYNTKFNPTTSEPNTVTDNEPFWGFEAANAVNGTSEENDLYSAGNATQFQVISIPFKAYQPGVVTFSILNNSNLYGYEYTDADGDHGVVGTDPSSAITLGQSFSVTITAVPEPASFSLLGLGAMSLLARWRRTTR
jgi:PEP-CTERM motif-containing protein